MISVPFTNMLLPLPWNGLPSQCPFATLSWIKDLTDLTYLSLFLRGPQDDLPVGYRSYVVSFHLEVVDVDWVDRQSARVDGPIIVLHDGSYYDWPHASNVMPITYITWHEQMARMLELFGSKSSSTAAKTKTYKASMFCNRITQSKMLIFAALAEHIGMDECVLTLSDWLEEKNVHHGQLSGHDELDNLMKIFFNKYFGRVIRHDDFDPNKNFQVYNSNWAHPAYQNAALHFSGESFHYSLMHAHVYPGPLICEKTFKPILAEQPFVPVGQFEIYKSLKKLGFEFDFGFDISWDADPGNLSRLANIVQLIKTLKHISIQDILDQSAVSCRHNRDHVRSGDFAKICRNLNEQSIQKILSIL